MKFVGEKYPRRYVCEMWILFEHVSKVIGICIVLIVIRLVSLFSAQIENSTFASTELLSFESIYFLGFPNKPFQSLVCHYIPLSTH